MIDVKEAAQIAKRAAAEVLGQTNTRLEELELDSSDARPAWMITLSYPRDVEQLPPMARLAADPLQYKRFFIDAESGELVAIKLREFAVR